MTNPKGSKQVTRLAYKLRKDFADNVRSLMEERYPESRYPNKSARERALAKDSHIVWSTLQRLLSSEVAVRLDVVADLAAALGVSASDLLQPDFRRQYRGSARGGGNDADDNSKSAATVVGL